MKIDRQVLLEETYNTLCKQLSVHRLPRWELLPDIELYMDQVIAVMERFLSLYNIEEGEDNRLITPSIINNYVKLKIIPAPNKKRYNREHLAYLLIICILKQTLAISTIVSLLEQQRKEKSVETFYNEFCDMYEQVVSMACPAEPAFMKIITDDVSLGTHLFYAAIVAVSGRFLCEGTLWIFSKRNKAEKDKKNDKEKKLDKDKKEVSKE